jgi:predicted nucleotidyltransferase
MTIDEMQSLLANRRWVCYTILASFPVKRMGRSMTSVSCTPVTNDLLREIVQRITAAFDPETIILFGSRAYGQAESDSDIDLLIITDALANRNVFERRRAVSDLFPHRLFALDVLVRTPAEMRELIERGPTLFKDIVTQGKILYERRPRRVAPKGRSRLPDRPYPAAAAQDTAAG